MRSRIFRSILFTPGDKPSAQKKAFGLLADWIIVDLEDAVGPGQKDNSREIVSKMILEREVMSKNTTYMPFVALRINCPITSPWGKNDLSNIPLDKFDALVLPKCENELNIEVVNKFLSEKNYNIPIWPMIESSTGVLNARAIATHPRVETLVVGTNDLSKDIKCRKSVNRLPLIYSLSHTILAARAANKKVIDGVFMNIKDLPGLQEESIQSYGLGFDGKSLIHPNQISTVNEIFSPALEDIEYSQRVIQAYTDAEKKGQGVCLLDDKLIEKLHVDIALETLKIAENIRNR